MSLLCVALLSTGMLVVVAPVCLAAPAPVPAQNSVWYLAEGSTAWGFSTGIAIENPNPVEVTARITYMDTVHPIGRGIIKTSDVALPAASETWINPDSDLEYPYDFSTKVECLQGLPIAVERSMGWVGGMGQAFGAQDSIGVTSPATSWYLPEGSSAWGFECWTLVQNPNNTEANITITYMVEGAGARAFSRKVPAYSRVTYNMADDIGAADASIEVTSDIPVIPERSMYDYWTPESVSVGLVPGTRVRREGACSIGSTTPATDYFLAEGTTAWGFTTYVLVQNPNNAEAIATLTYDTDTGPIKDAPFTIPPESCQGGRLLGFPKYIADDIPLKETGDGWLGEVRHEGKAMLSLEYTGGGMRALEPWEKELIDGGALHLEEPIFLFAPPDRGSRFQQVTVERVKPDEWKIEEGMVRVSIDSSEPWAGLIPPGTEAPGFFQRFTGGTILVPKKLA